VLPDHCASTASPADMGFMLYDLLKDTGYDDEEIQEVASAMTESAEGDWARNILISIKDKERLLEILWI